MTQTDNFLSIVTKKRPLKAAFVLELIVFSCFS